MGRIHPRSMVGALILSPSTAPGFLKYLIKKKGWSFQTSPFEKSKKAPFAGLFSRHAQTGISILKRDIILVVEVPRSRRTTLSGRLLLWSTTTLLRWRAALLRRSSSAALVTSASLIASTSLASAKQLHVLADDTEATPLLTSGLVIPGIKLETALDVYRAALGKILTCHFSLATPEGHIDKGDFFDAVTVVSGPHAIHGHGDV